MRTRGIAPPLVATFDRDAFPGALTARGFEVVRDSHSNYLQTPLTLASMLSMRHLADLPELAPPYGPVMADWRRLRGVLDDGAAFAILREAGYEVTVLDAGYGHAQMRRVDRFVESIRSPRSWSSSSCRTPASRASWTPSCPRCQRMPRARASRRRSSRLRRSPPSRMRRPAFAFIHVSAPHPPWVLQRGWQPTDTDKVSFGGEPGLTDQAGAGRRVRPGDVHRPTHRGAPSTASSPRRIAHRSSP